MLRPLTKLLFFCAVPVAFAQQQPEEIAPRGPEPMPPGDVEVEEPPPVLEEADEVLLDRVRTLVFYGDPADELPETGALPEGIVLRDLEVPAEQRFRMVMEPFLEGPLTLGSLRRITRNVVLHYREEDLPVVDAIVPEQEITEGVVKILVLEGRITALHTEGNEYFANALLRRQIRLGPGERIRGQTVREDIEWLNRNPFRQVSGVFTPGEEPGDTELVLVTEDRPTVRLYGGYENTGHRLTRRDRWLAGLNWGNAFRQDHQFNYQFTFSGDLESFRAHSASYIMPFPWRHIATLFGSYIDTQADVAAPFELTGRSWQTGARYAIPLPRPRRTTFSHELRFGGDFKSTNTNLEFGGDEIFDTEVEIVQGMAGYEMTWSDRAGDNFAGLDIFYSPGGLTGRNEDEVFRQAREDATAEYLYARLRGERTTNLPADLSWEVSGALQASSERLFFSEQLGIGGYRSVRGYLERESSGDQGLYIRNDLRSPDWRGLDSRHQVNLVAFFDAGRSRIRDPRGDESGSTTLAGAGAGIRYRIGRYFLARLDLAFPLRDGPDTDSGDPRLHAGVTASW